MGKRGHRIAGRKKYRGKRNDPRECQNDKPDTLRQHANTNLGEYRDDYRNHKQPTYDGDSPREHDRQHHREQSDDANPGVKRLQ